MTTLSLDNLRVFLRTVRDQGIATAVTKARKRMGRDAVGGDTSAPPIADEPLPPLPVDPTLQAPDDSLVLPDPGPAPDISIIIPVYNQWTHTWNCLKTIAEACRNHRCEVILADDGSSDDTVTAAPAIRHLVIVRDGKNRGFLGNCNHAARVARGTFLVLLNNDSKCAPHALDLLADCLQADPRIGIAGAKLVYPDGRLQECGGIVFSDGSAANHGHSQRPDRPGFMHVRAADYISGATLMIRRELWDGIGGFDARFAPAYYEDTDLAMAVRARGFAVVVVPRAVVVHYEGVSHGTDVGKGIKAHQARNRAVFAAKWADVLAADHVPPGTAPWVAAAGGADRPRVLVIDHYVPEPDRDAGSACTGHYLQSLVGIGCQVVFLGENFARSEPYTSALEAIGIEVWVGGWHANRWREVLAERAGAIDVVLFNRPHITEVFLPDIRRILPRARLVYFGHDLHFLRERRAAVLASGAERERLLQRSQDWERREAEIHRAVDAAITISADEVAMIRADFAVDDVSVFPGYVYPGVDAPMALPSGAPTALFVGGFGHPPNHDAVAWFLAEIWPRVRAAVPAARLWIVGSNMPVSLRHPAPGVTGLGWLSEDDLQARYRAAQVVVAPLRFGAGLKGKVVQAMALGLPVVTTAIGCEGLPDRAKDVLGRYDAPADFAARVAQLFRDPAKNRAFRVDVLAEAKRHFSRAASQDFFRDLVGRLRPQLGWSEGLAHDGWMGRRARLRAATPGRYRIAVWCPQFHFIAGRGPVTLTAHVDGKVIAHLVFSDSRNAELMIDVTGAARREVVEFRISRSTVPKAVGVGEDVRELGLKLVACEPVCDQQVGAADAGSSRVHPG